MAGTQVAHVHDADAWSVLMRRLFIVAAAIAACALPSVVSAQSANTEVQGFGGLTFGSSTFGSTSASTFGGRVAVDLMPNMQVIGEGGRMSDIKSPLFELLDFTPVGVRLSAWYGEAGVRFITSHSAVRPYFETTAGIARLTPAINGINGRTDAIVDAGLAFLNRTEPMLGAGGGLLVQGGPVTLDLGYRYNKIFAGGTVASVLNAGSEYNVNQVRVGVGVRF
jgi:opacity protein-like surface antigen